jgi:spore maturation protein CgeB
MRVLVIGSEPRVAAPNHLPWLRYVVAALKRLGHAVEVATYRESWAASPTIEASAIGVPWASAALTRWRRTTQRRRDWQAVSRARAFRPQLTIVLKGEVYAADVFADLKGFTEGPLTSWWVDDPFAYPRSVQDFHLFDRVFVFDRSYLPALAAVGIGQTAFLPCACDETVYRPQALSARARTRWGSEVALVASFYPNRAQLARALSYSVDLGVWGNGWTAPAARHELRDRSGILRGGGVDDRTAARIYAATKVGLNVHHPQSRLGGLNMRTFELLAAGVVPLTDWVPGLEELLEPDREIVCYRSPAEAQERVADLVKDADCRAAIATRGRARVLAQHTYVARMKTLCEVACT